MPALVLAVSAAPPGGAVRCPAPDRNPIATETAKCIRSFVRRGVPAAILKITLSVFAFPASVHSAVAQNEKSPAGGRGFPFSGGRAAVHPCVPRGRSVDGPSLAELRVYRFAIWRNDGAPGIRSAFPSASAGPAAAGGRGAVPQPPVPAGWHRRRPSPILAPDPIRLIQPDG